MLCEALCAACLHGRCYINIIYSRYKYQIILFFCRLKEGHQCFYLIQAGLLQCSLMLESAGAVYTDCTRRSDHIKPNLAALHWLPVTFTAVFLSLEGSDSCLGLFLTSMSPIAVRDPLVNLDFVTEGAGFRCPGPSSVEPPQFPL